MKLKTITKEEIETLSFDDLAYIILKEKGKKMKTTDLFKTICELQNLDEKAYEEQIADFFTLLATEKRFIQLDKGCWDLRENHSIKIEQEEDDELDEEIIHNDIEEESEENYLDENKEIDDDETEDDLKDLVVIDENELEDEL